MILEAFKEQSHNLWKMVGFDFVVKVVHAATRGIIIAKKDANGKR